MVIGMVIFDDICRKSEEFTAPQVQESRRHRLERLKFRLEATEIPKVSTCLSSYMKPGCL